MGLVLFVAQIGAEILGFLWAYVFGTRVIGSGLFLAYQGSPVAFVHSIPYIFHLRPAWTSALLAVTPAHFGVLWVVLYLSLRLIWIGRALFTYIQARSQLAKPHPDGDYERPIQACYARFEAYTIKASYPPLEFNVPPGFRYRPGAAGMEIGWIGPVLVINTQLIQSPQLAPRLAREVGVYNSLDRYYKVILSGTPPLHTLIGIIIGWGISFPSLLKKFVWCFYWRKRVFEYDTFAVRLGCGPELLKALETEKYHQTDRGFFRTTPYIEERIDRVKGLQKQAMSQKVKP